MEINFNCRLTVIYIYYSTSERRLLQINKIIKVQAIIYIPKTKETSYICSSSEVKL